MLHVKVNVGQYVTVDCHGEQHTGFVTWVSTPGFDGQPGDFTLMSEQTGREERFLLRWITNSTA